MKSLRFLKPLLPAVALALIASTPNAEASLLYSTNYGDFNAVSVCYSNVTEHSGTDATPLYNAPSVIGDTLDFNPTFIASASGAGGNDTTDGHLGMYVCASTGNYIDALEFYEAGLYNLSGFSNEAYVDISAGFIVSVLEVDNVELLQPINATNWMTYSMDPNGSVYLSDNYPQNDGLWTGEMSIDIEGLLTPANGIDSYTYGATRVRVDLDNSLTALSQEGTSAYIDKKGVQAFSVTSIPEPASVLLLIGTTSAITFIRRLFIG